MSLTASTKRREHARRKTDPDGRALCSCGCGQHPAPPRRNALQCVRERLVFIEAAYNGLTEKKLPTSVYFPQEKVVPPPAGAEPEPAAPAPDNKPAAPAKK